MEVPIDLIRPSPYQPRLDFELEDLKGSVMKDGIASPLIIRQMDEGYELIDGQRRLMLAKELGYETVPCEVIDADDEKAMRLVWRLNIERKDYTPKEKAYHFYNRQREGMSLREIGRIFGYSHPDVLMYLNVFKLPEEYQEAVWEGHIPISNIRELGPLFNSGGNQLPEILQWLDQRLPATELRKALNPTLAKFKEQQVQKAQQAVGEISPEIILETPQDYERAAAALREEAKRMAETLLTPEERAAREAEAQARAENGRRREEERQRRKEEERRRLEEEAREKATQELFENPTLLKQAAERLADLKRREREARLKAQQAAIPMPLTEADLVHKVVIGDAKEVLRLLLPLSVDLVVTSPPYFGLKDYEHNLGVNTESLKDYLDDLGGVFQECYRTLKDGTFLCVVVGQYTSEDASYFIPGQVSKLLEDLGFRYKREHIWVKPLGTQGIWNRGTTSFLFQPFPRNTMINIHHEHILIFQKGEKSAVFLGQNPLTEEEVKQYCWSIWELLVSDIKEHPAPFPEAIPERLIKMYSYEGEVVLDPFLGAGTTMKVAKALKRRSIGIEVSPEYLNLIQQTIGGADVIRFDEGKSPDFSYLATPKA